MARKSTPVMGMSIVLILVLALAGLAFTQWTGSIFVTGSATTAGVDLGWDDSSYLGCTETDVTFVSPTEVHLSRPDAVQGDTDTCMFTYMNNGTIPVKIANIIKTGDVPGEFSVGFTDGIDSVLNPGDSKIIEVNYLVEAGAQPNTTYDFSVEIVGEQS